jgi:elongator complex protein 1
MSGGDIVLVKVETEIHEERVEVIGNVEGGILAAEWTADEEVLAIASGSHLQFRILMVGRSNLLFMTSGFEIIAEVPLSSGEVSKHINQVSVGWGRAETQFRGLRAKNAPRDPTLPEKVDQGVLSPDDDGKIRLNWRGDGECLAFSRIEEEQNKPPKRVIRVYTRDGQIESFSEPIDGLEGVLAWRPSGNWIATVQRKSIEEADVVFLERNGLRHGGFALRTAGARIRDLAWNSESNILSILLDDRLQMWMMSNYDWHLKQEVIVAKEDATKFRAFWHPEKPFILFTTTTGTLLVRSD